MPTTLAKKLATPHVESPFFNQLFDVEHPYYSYAKEINSNGYAFIRADQLFPTSHFADRLVMEIRQRFQNKNIPKRTQNLNNSISIVDEFRARYQSLVDQHRKLPKDFYSEKYLALHPDVKEGGMNPIKHYILYGRNEGRLYK